MEAKEENLKKLTSRDQINKKGTRACSLAHSFNRLFGNSDKSVTLVQYVDPISHPQDDGGGVTKKPKRGPQFEYSCIAECKKKVRRILTGEGGKKVRLGRGVDCEEGRGLLFSGSANKRGQQIAGILYETCVDGLSSALLCQKLGDEVMLRTVKAYRRAYDLD